MIYLALFLIIVLLILIVIYPIKSFLKFTFLNKINNKFLKILLCFIPLIITLLLFGFVDFVIIVLHLSIFLLLAFLVLYLYQKITKKDLDKKKYFKKLKIMDLRNIIAIILTIIYLGIGAYLDLNVFETKYEIYTEKEIGSDFRIVLISDSHIGTTFDGEGFYKHIKELSKIESDIFVITGDFVDDSTTYEDMVRSCESLKELKPKYGVYYVFGNHDRGYYNNRNFSGDDLVNELEKNNVFVLRDNVVELNDYFYLIGREDRSNSSRKSINELVKDLDVNHYMIVLNHQPNDYLNEREAKVDLVLSGHSHGGQIWPLGPISILLGQNDAYYGLKKMDNTNFIVTSGISDWATIFKTGTKSEYVIIDIKKK